MWARIADGVVFEFEDEDPAGRFHPDLVWVACDGVAGIAQGWSYDGTTFAPPPAAPPNPDEVLAAKVAAGIVITGNPAVAATYALDPVSTAEIFEIGLYASQFGVFPSGAAAQLYPDITGDPTGVHSFTVAQFVAFLRAVAPLVSALKTQVGVMAQGGTPAWPSQSATLA
jgi:hypothetical protein